MICQKCLTSRTGDVVGQPCKTTGCGGIIEEDPVFSTLVDELPEPMTCGRRYSADGVGQDRWQRFKSNGDRVCSYCGSLHFDDFARFVKEAAEAPADAPYGIGPEIEPSDKGYKVYVTRKSVRNASEGGIKFYMQHVPLTETGSLAVTEEQNRQYAEAVRRSRARFDRYLYGIRSMHDAKSTGQSN